MFSSMAMTQFTQRRPAGISHHDGHDVTRFKRHDDALAIVAEEEATAPDDGPFQVSHGLPHFPETEALIHQF